MAKAVLRGAIEEETQELKENEPLEFFEIMPLLMILLTKRSVLDDKYAGKINIVHTSNFIAFNIACKYL